MGTQRQIYDYGDPGQIDLPRRVTSGLKESTSYLNPSKVGMV
jgi:phosphate starvation-inducible protein PhoH